MDTKKDNEQTKKLYHVTTEKNVPSIMEKGLFPQRPSSIYGELSKRDPNAVYTFLGIGKEPIKEDRWLIASIKAMEKHPAETSFLKKGKQKRQESAILEISLPIEEYSKRVLPPSYNAQGIEAPIKGKIPSNFIKRVWLEDGNASKQ
jgi:hypothetical protein